MGKNDRVVDGGFCIFRTAENIFFLKAEKPPKKRKKR
jgi:hypothetical protein